jgi:[acyl-carrier-protein] S-malonyltransferase
MTVALAVVFPGQGSQRLGMLADLANRTALIRNTFNEASEVLSEDLWEITQRGPEATLNLTRYTQPAMLVSGIAIWRAVQELVSQPPRVLAGHSLGEYTALVAGGALSFADAVRLVRLRADLMQGAVSSGDGGMAAILGLDEAGVQELCAQHAGSDVLEAANFNAPGQIVIAGHAAAVQRAVSGASAAGARKAVMLSVSVPAHCSLMQPVGAGLADVLKQIDLRLPAIPVLHNVNASSAGTQSELFDLLLEQLHRPVRWVETITRMGKMGVTHVLEAGPGRVLTGLGKRIDKEIKHSCVEDSKSLEEFISSLGV